MIPLLLQLAVSPHSPSPVRPASALRPRSWGIIFLLLALPLAGQSPVGTWATDLERHAAFGPEVAADITEQGVITFRADHTYTAARNRNDPQMTAM